MACSIELIVRGVCALRPGVPGVSENIRVRSVVGRFLEHSRAYWFHNDGSNELYLASADWMERNFFRRVEIAFPVQRPQHRERIFKDLETYLADDTNAWEMQSDGSSGTARPSTVRLRTTPKRGCWSVTQVRPRRSERGYSG